MNRLRLTNVIENHFYLDFNWKDEGPVPSVSRQQKPPSRPKTVRDTDDMGHWSVSRRNKEKVWVQAPVLSNRCTFYVSFPQRIRIFGSRITDSFSWNLANTSQPGRNAATHITAPRRSYAPIVTL